MDYDVNSMMTGDVSKLKNVVEGAVFKARVEVLGSFSCDRQIGGSATVPMFRVVSMKRHGSTD